MKIELLQNPLSKGEKWEAKDKREIEITQSGDNRGMKPNVYFSISAPLISKKYKGGVGPMEITEDLFIPTELAIKIGKQLIKEAKAIDKEYNTKIVDKYKKKRREIASRPRAVLTKDKRHLSVTNYKGESFLFTRISPKEFDKLNKSSFDKLNTDTISRYRVACKQNGNSKEYFFTTKNKK